MPDIELTAWQGLMDSAYGKWNDETGVLKGASYETFLASLPTKERQAVLLGNLNYQVGNGGFHQWVANGYALKGQEVIDILELIVCDSGTTSVEEKIGVQLIARIRWILSRIDLNARNRGFGGDYWKKGRRVSHNSKTLDRMDTWYYDKVHSILHPAIERYFSKG